MNLPVSPYLTDKSPAFKTADQRANAIVELGETLSALSFFKQTVESMAPPASVADVYTHLSLLEHHLTELSRLTGYDGMCTKENEARYAEIRAANQKIRELEAQLGSTMTGDAVASGVRHYLNVLGTWWSAAGFRYAKMEPTQWGISAEFSSEVILHERESTPYADSALLIKANGKVDPITTDDFDVREDKYHGDLLDTDRNKKALDALFRKYFPEAYITGFRSHHDSSQFCLRFTVYFNYKELEAWEKTLDSESESGKGAPANG